MKELMQRILLEIEQMSDEQFDRKLDAARSGEIAIAMRHLQEASVWAQERLIIEKFFEIMSCLDKVEVAQDRFEDYSWVPSANDERFALAA